MAAHAECGSNEKQKTNFIVRPVRPHTHTKQTDGAMKGRRAKTFFASDVYRASTHLLEESFSIQKLIAVIAY